MTGEPCEIGILFGDVCDSTRLYETYGDQAARTGVEHCLNAMMAAVQEHSGTVVQIIGDEVMAMFEEPDAMISAARAMQIKVDSLTPLLGPRGGVRLGIRVGFHFGPAIKEHDLFFGDTVNTASRMAGLAKSGQIITTFRSQELLSPWHRGGTRDLDFIAVKGKAEPVRIVEVIWRDSPDVTIVNIHHDGRPALRNTLRLEHGQSAWIFDPGRDPGHDRITLGREATNDVVLLAPRASRRHATIERRGDKWVLVDHSTNGSFLTFAGRQRIFLKREELILHSAGLIDFGDPLDPELPGRTIMFWFTREA